MLSPPRGPLNIKTVLEYVFLGQFDLLRDSRFEVQNKPWTRAAEREAAVTYFKLQRSREEILRLNVEMRRLATFIHDSELLMSKLVTTLESTDPALAHQLKRRQTILIALNRVHSRRLLDIEGLAAFSGSTGIGKAVIDLDLELTTTKLREGEEGEGDDDDDADAETGPHSELVTDTIDAAIDMIAVATDS